MGKILVAEDNRSALEMIVKFLEGLGFIVVPTINGLEAKKRFEITNPEAVVTDIKMPIMDGFELLSFIKKLRPEIPVFVLSDHCGIPEYQDRIRKLGGNGCFEKSDLSGLAKGLRANNLM